nr:hypothetical protein Iba_chr08fCG1250 [Ipomoea batatas]
MIHQQFSKSPVTTVVDLVSIVLNRRIGDHHCHVWAAEAEAVSSDEGGMTAATKRWRRDYGFRYVGGGNGGGNGEEMEENMARTLVFLRRGEAERRRLWTLRRGDGAVDQKEREEIMARF